MGIEGIKLYRITHIKNVPHILKCGITTRNSSSRNNDFVRIGDSSLIAYRENRKIRIKDKEIVLGDYIPFYFGTRMPMLYVIQHGFNFSVHASPGEIVYICVSLKKIVDDHSIEMYFTDGHATDGMTSFYGRDEIERLPEVVDWNAVQARYWVKDGVDTDLKRRKQAEFLAGKDIPYEYILRFGCYDENARNALIGYGIEENKIYIVPEIYF